MQLTKHTDYAFRVLIYLAGIKDELTTIKVVTEVFGVSKTHLMKVVNQLANKDWVESTRGKNGGIRLGCAPEDINLKDVVMHMERTLDPINCDQPPCQIKGLCRLKPLLVQAQNQYLDHLAQYTLADLCDQKTTDVLLIKWK